MRVQQSTSSFALCVEDGGLEDLEARKLYQVVPDREAAREGTFASSTNPARITFTLRSCSFP
jgi:hypothetical protein